MNIKNQISFLTLMLTATFLWAQSTPDLKMLLGVDETIKVHVETETCLWIGTNNGLYQVKKKNMKVSHYTAENSSLPSNIITSICTKPDGQVYIGTYKGVLRYDRFAFILITKENSRLASDRILSLRYDPDKGVIAETEEHIVCTLK